MSKSDVNSDAHHAEALYNKATKEELARNYDQAFGLYIKATEVFLHLSRSATQQEREKAKWKANAQRALERAEKIKGFIEKSKGGSSHNANNGRVPQPEFRLTPVGINHFSPQEQFYVLKKGGSINGLVYSLWDDPIHHAAPTTTVYTDPDGQPKLSPEQQKVSPVWRRPTLSTGSTSGSLLAASVFRKILPQDILQHIVTDCSVCASISVCLEHARRFGSNIAESALCKARTIDGRYDVRILFNGAWRRVVIDDKLPYDSVDGTLMCMSVFPHGEPRKGGGVAEALWPSLLEKGYMKLMGGYDFPGSNSSIDLHSLAGWIPEHIEIKRSDFEGEKSWARIETGFSSGQCVVTLGTGTSHNIQWRDVNLLPSHSYAVIDVQETKGGRELTVLDSWVRSTGDIQEPSRILKIPWIDVLNTFDGIYLSWDPARWQKSLVFHGMWKRNGSTEDASRHVRLNFNTTSLAEEEIWVLLTRHVVQTSRNLDFIALRIEIEDNILPAVLPMNQLNSLSTGTYTNSTHILRRIRIPSSQRSGALSILGSYDGDAREVGFSLSAYSHSSIDISWDENVPDPPYTKKVDGRWTSKNAGGNCTFPTFMVNPQYHLRIHPPKSRVGSNASGKARTTLSLQASKDVPVNVATVWSQGQRIVEFSEKDIAASSGAYSYGLARIAKDIAPGEYTVVASAFESHHMGPFSLKVDCSFPFDLQEIPQEGAGMYTKVVLGAWEERTAAGGPSFDRYSNNPRFELEVPSLAQVKIRLQLLQPSTATSLNVTIYPVPSPSSFVVCNLTNLRHTATSGAYDDCIAGVATPQIALAKGKYWIVPSTYNPGMEARFKIIVYSSVKEFEVKGLLN